MSLQPPLSSFHPFPLLPAELKLKMWSHALTSTPYQSRQTHHITAKLCTPSQLQTTLSTRLGGLLPTGSSKHLTNLPLGFEELCPLLKFSSGFGKHPTIYTSRQPIHPLLLACRDSRATVLGECKGLEWAFGTYVDFERDRVFLDIGADVRVILPLVLGMPRRFEGLAVRRKVTKTVERKGQEDVWRSLGKLGVVHEENISGDDIRDIKELELVDYEVFHGEHVDRSIHWNGEGVKKEHVVAVDRKWVCRAQGQDVGDMFRGMEFKIWRWMRENGMDLEYQRLIRR